MKLIFPLKNPIGYLVGLLFWVTAMNPPLDFLSGIERLEPVGKYFNGNFPSETPRPAEGAYILKNAFPALDFTSPIHITQEPGTNRMLVAEHGGKIWAFPKDSAATQKSLFLDISSQTLRQGEAGLLNFAFHPEYGKSNTYLYVFYVFKDTAKGFYERVSRFEVPIKNGSANLNSEVVLIQQYDRKNSHNGGGLFFGNDGFLYISLGDEGGANNLYGNAQAIDDRLFGGVLRIDVDQDTNRSHPIRRQPQRIEQWDRSYTANYYIPNDNPWISPDSSYLEEFYAIGLRNPHRMSFDGESGRAWIGDVGQGRREEVCILEKGANYQWSYQEGELSASAPKPDSIHFLGKDTPPLYAYEHRNGNVCIVGGYQYRGTVHPELYGAYIFADNGSRRIWALRDSVDTVFVETLLTASVSGSGYNGISAFGTDEDQELYILVMNGSGRPGGKVYTLAREKAAIPDPPKWLSETGAFKDLASLTPADFLIPYEPNEPFWSDGAIKKRWMAIPNDGDADSESEKIQTQKAHDWAFPKGSVFIKHFEIPFHELNSDITRRLETRFLVHGEDGRYYGFSYKWLRNGLDAELLKDSYQEEISVIQENGETRNQTWYYPAREECLTCHKSEIGSILGANHYQLDGSIYYPRSGKQAHQLSTLTGLGLLSDSLSQESLNKVSGTVAHADTQATLAIRARSYLEANCSSCHVPEAGLRSVFDTRFDIPLTETRLILGELADNMGDTLARVIVPGDTLHSALYQRLKSLEAGIAMPPLSKNRIDQNGVELIAEWILSMNPVGRLPQTLTLDSIPDQLITTPYYLLYAAASSGLPVSLQVVDGPATLVGDTLKLEGETGTVTLMALQAGNEHYEAADTLLQSFEVGKLSQSIIFSEVPDMLTNQGPVPLEATSSSALPIIFRLVSGPGILQGDTLFLTGEPGTIKLEASQPGNAAYDSASSVSQTLVVTQFVKQQQAITLTPIPDKLALDPPFGIEATASSGLSLEFVIRSGPARLQGDQIVLLGSSGTVILEARQGGDSLFSKAIPVLDTFEVNRVSQSLDFPPISDQDVFADPFLLEGTSSSQLPLQYQVLAGPANLEGHLLYLAGTSGTVIVEASQAGNEAYEAADPVRQSFFVHAQLQEISFPHIEDKYVNDPPIRLNAFASSGLEISYILKAGPGRLSRDTLYLTGAEGVLTVGAVQGGNGAYEPTDTLFQSFSVRKAPQSLTFFDIPDLTLITPPVKLAAELSSGNPVRFRKISGPIELQADTVLLTGEVGTAEVEAYHPGDSVYVAISQTQRFSVSKASQHIIFSPIPDKWINSQPFLLEVEASSGLPITLELLEGPALISGTAVFLTQEPGEVKIRAFQTGDSLFKAADPVIQSFQVVDTTQQDTLTTDIQVPLGKSLQVQVFPNPLQSEIGITIVSTQSMEIEGSLFSLQGQEILKTSWKVFPGEHRKLVPLQPMASGMYVLRVNMAGQPQHAQHFYLYKQ